MNTEGDPAPKKPSLFQVISSVLSAAVGVQSSSNRARDFTHGSAKVYIIAGLIFTALFIVAVVTVVKLVLKSAGT